MASIIKLKNGTKLIQFAHPDGSGRKTIHLGKASLKYAEAVKVKVESLRFSVQMGHAPEAETAVWLSNLPRAMRMKLERVGLVQPENVATLKEFTDAYIEKRHDLKESTLQHVRRAQADLIEFFGENKPLRKITPGDAEEFRLHLLGRGLAENTVRRRCGRAKQFFNAAIKKELVSKNPFVDIKSAVQPNTKRFHFVTREAINKILDSTSDVEWQLIIALCRYGGLRCPSEVLELKWEHIRWDENRIIVPSPKTEHHQGGETRSVPLFPELLPFLEEGRRMAKPESEYVITRYRTGNGNLRTQFCRIVRRAGLEPWGKPFQNMRSTRETELAEKFPMHVVCGWIGNTEMVAAKHYLQTTDEHFHKASTEATGASAVKSAAAALQKAVQRPAVNRGESSREMQKTPENSEVSREIASFRARLRGAEAPRQGLEP